MAKYPKSGALIIGLILIALGVIFLVENFYGPFSAWQLIARYWPVCLIIIGLSKLVAYFLRAKENVDTPDEESPKEVQPSLLAALLWTGLGILFLLSNLGAGVDVWTLTKSYWPVLLILLGAGKVADYYYRKATVSLRFGEFLGLVCILFLGILFTQRSETQLGRVFREMPFKIGNVSVRPGQWLGISHAYTEETTFPLDGKQRIRIENSHGMVSVSPGSDGEIRVRLKKLIYADEDRARVLAGKIHLQGVNDPAGSGTMDTGETDSVLVLRSNRDSIDAGDSRVDTEMEIFVPRNSQLQVKNSFGAVRVVGIDGNLDLNTTHRDLEVRDCQGEFVVSSRYGECRLINLTGNLNLKSRSSAYLENVRGDVNVSNEFSPTVISRVDGKVTATVSEGDLRIEDVSQPVIIDARGSEVYVARLQDDLKITASHRSVRVQEVESDITLDSRYATIYLKDIQGDVRIQSDTDNIQVDSVEGSLTMNGRGSGIRVFDAEGKLNLRTTLKDIFVDEWTGSCSIENEYANVRLSLGDLEQNDVNIKNRNGRIDLFLPEGADFSLNAVASQGRVESFYEGLEPDVRTGNTGTLDYNMNSAGAKIRLVNDYGNIRIFGGDSSED